MLHYQKKRILKIQHQTKYNVELDNSDMTIFTIVKFEVNNNEATIENNRIIVIINIEEKDDT